MSTGTCHMSDGIDLLVEIGNLRWNLLHALAALDDALWTLERVNGRAQVSDEAFPSDFWAALRDIRAYCEKALNK